MNKKCCECDLAASVQFVSIGPDGCVSQFDLCETHAKKRGIYEENAYFIADGLKLKNKKKLLEQNYDLKSADAMHCTFVDDLITQINSEE